MSKAESESKDFQAFLDEHQYTREGILSYEFVFGYGYVSTGGSSTTKTILAEIGLEKGMRVLDIGCGIGGGDIEMARRYGVSVLGVDLSTNMLAIGRERLSEAVASEEGLGEGKVELKELDITKAEFEDESFDVVYSRDCLMHLPDYTTCYERVFKWLKPGGKLVVTDYCRGEKTSEEYEAYVKQRQYRVIKVKDYGAILSSVGFADVRAEDATDTFVACLKTERARTIENRSKFIEAFGEAQLQYLIDGWDAKLERCPAGFQAWGKFTATKPLALEAES